VEKQKIDKADNRRMQGVAGGLVGVAVIAVFQLLTLSSLDKRLTVSLYCFATSIPLLSFFVQSKVAESWYTNSVSFWYTVLPLLIGATIWFVGLAAVFFHFSIIVGLIFSLLAILGVISVTRYQALLEEVNKP
jgi:hypothetical protein